MSDAVSVSDRRESVADRVAAEILKLIAGGDIEPGSNLPAERKLSVMLGVSRVSVRAALQTLKAQGFIDAVQGGGTRVVARASGADPALAELVRL
ncbi:MAG TPA: FadR family transcriptional regulator, partial [Rhodospirillaceae bacterium]|nr:FadR family transcriptional regulator [Rhodospirillaceae bacterium]